MQVYMYMYEYMYMYRRSLYELQALAEITITIARA